MRGKRNFLAETSSFEFWPRQNSTCAEGRTCSCGWMTKRKSVLQKAFLMQYVTNAKWGVQKLFSPHRCRSSFQLTEAADPKPVHKPASRVRGTAATAPLDTPAIGEWYDPVSVCVCVSKQPQNSILTLSINPLMAHLSALMVSVDLRLAVLPSAVCRFQPKLNAADVTLEH